jgi:glycosyltransferase involved in cell wall biosynthesis
MALKFSIITPSYNQGSFIEQTILSVANQPDIEKEHIVMDGGSNDETVAVLKKYPHLKWVSEKDKGQADALSKGIKLVSGDIVGWINSDDYYEDNIFASVAKQFEDPEVMWVIGNLACVFDSTQEVVADVSPVVTYQRLLGNPNIVRQQPAFFRREFLLRVGGWNPAYFMVMDYDLWVRLAKASTPKMVNETWAFFRFHALQKSTHANILRQSREISRILKREHAGLSIRIKFAARKRSAWMRGIIKSYFIKAGLLDKRYQNRPVRLKSRGSE